MIFDLLYTLVVRWKMSLSGVLELIAGAVILAIKSKNPNKDIIFRVDENRTVAMKTFGKFWQ